MGNYLISNYLIIKIVIYNIMDTTSGKGFSVKHLVFNTPECITKMPNTDTCSTKKG